MMSRSTILFASMSLTMAGAIVAALPPTQKKKPASRATSQSTPKDEFGSIVAPFVGQYCSGCHGSTVKMADINLSLARSTATMVKARTTWEKVSLNIAGGTMPPAGSKQPSAADRSKVVAWIDRTLSQVDCQIKDAGRVTMRRLNREEYNNTVRDLLETNLRVADEFPSDDVGYGFDNIGDVLTLSPLHMERYMNAAERLSRAAIWVSTATKPLRHWDAGELRSEQKLGTDGDQSLMLSSNSEVFNTFPAAVDSDFLIRVKAYGMRAGKELPKMEVKVDGKSLRVFEVTALKISPETYSARVHLSKGKYKISAAFTNDFYDPTATDPSQRDRNLAITSMEVCGAASEPPAELPALHKRLIPKDPAPGEWESEARKSLTPFLRRAYRRPVTADEVNRLVKRVMLAQANNELYARGIQLAIQAVLVSPHFLFRVELDRDPNNPRAVRVISDHEFASRLSYFLWCSMPDDELSRLADQGKLKQPDVLNQQIKRMLKDDRSNALVDNFGTQWLQLRNLANVAPDPVRFPMFNEKLRTAMRRETELFIGEVFRQDKSLLELIDANYTYLNEPLAGLYGIAGVKGEDFRRVALTDRNRGGLLTQASILTITSNPTRTSPVKRGKWVLEQILGTPPPPPPPDVPELKEKSGALQGTLRERMTQHRKDPMCASCHAKMDPIGFGLENFDAVGKWRDKEDGTLIDTSGQLAGGVVFHGPAELKGILRSKKDLFVKSFTEKLMTFGLGRGLEVTDRCFVQTIAERLQKSNYRFSALVGEIVKSEPFRIRKGDGGLK